MKTITVFVVFVATVLASQAAVVPAKAPVPGAVYIVTRAASAESRALLSARLIKLNVTKLRWYDDTNVVRGEAPKKALVAVRADRDVVLVLADHDHPSQVSIFDGPAQEAEAAAPKPAGLLLDPAPPLQSLPPAMPLQQTGCAASFSSSPMGQFPQIPGPGAGIGPMGGQPGMGGMGMMGMGLMDSLAGGVAQRLLNRTPSCKITVAKSSGRPVEME
jgi:hypothetical protein